MASSSANNENDHVLLSFLRKQESIVFILDSRFPGNDGIISGDLKRTRNTDTVTYF